MVVLESMLHSLPMVLSELTGPRTIVGQSNSAIMVPPENPLLLADALERLILDKQLAKTLACNAFNRVHAFSNQEVGPVLQKALAQLCNNMAFCA